jgi:hypothetical protein
MPKKIFIVFSILIIITLWPGCNKSVEEILVPDIGGTWDWIFNFTDNNCYPYTTEEEGYAIITQDYVDSETTTGTVEIYNKDDEDLDCPVWTFDYTMDSNGNMTIEQEDVPYDPQECANSASPDAEGDILMTLDATASPITGDVTFLLSSESEGWSCEQKGTGTFDNKH